jgi:hypothetical protein
MTGVIVIVLSVLMVGVFLLTMLLVKKGADRTAAARDKALRQRDGGTAPSASDRQAADPEGGPDE